MEFGLDRKFGEVAVGRRGSWLKGISSTIKYKCHLVEYIQLGRLVSSTFLPTFDEVAPVLVGQI
jgi:hypothetical protein